MVKIPQAPTKGANKTKEGKQGKRKTGAYRVNSPFLMYSVIIFIIIMLVYYYFGSFLVIVTGMAPTMLAYMVSGDSKALPRTIGAMNFAGVFLILVELWSQNHTPTHALELLADWENWGIMFAFAAVGLMIYWLVPPFVERYILTSLIWRRKKLSHMINLLEEEWGESVNKYSDLEGLRDAQSALESQELAQRKRRQQEERQKEVDESPKNKKAALNKTDPDKPEN